MHLFPYRYTIDFCCLPPPNRDEVELRGQNNIALSENVDMETLRSWYNFHNVVGSREAYLKNPVGVRGAKGGAFSLELFVHEDRVIIFCSSIASSGADTSFLFDLQYFARTNEKDFDDFGTQLQSKKRKAPSNTNDLCSRKRAASGEQCMSLLFLSNHDS